MLKNRDEKILERIIVYCDEIFISREMFGEEKEVFLSNVVYKNSVALCILQIGELTTHLTDDFKSRYKDVPWVQIKAMRNVVAHNYGSIDGDVLWETVMGDIPELKEYCIKILNANKQK